MFLPIKALYNMVKYNSQFKIINGVILKQLNYKFQNSSFNFNYTNQKN